MKTLGNAGKWMALMLTGAALLFSGCLGPSSSEDNAIPVKSGEVGARYVYKFSVTPEQGKLDIEPVVMDTGIATRHYGGHMVDVTSAPCTWANPNLTCAVTVTNKSKSYYMTNMRTWHYRSNSAESPTLDTADFPNTYTTTVTNSTWVQPSPRPLYDATKAGMCYLQDGRWSIGSINNMSPRGCRYYDVGGYGNFNYQILHPDCGVQTETWILGVATTPYHFYTALLNVGISGGPAGDTIAQGNPNWYPEKPFKVSGTTIVNNDGETRMDFTNLTLFEVVPTKLDILCPTGWAGCQAINTACISTANDTGDGYKIGAAQCSTPYSDEELKALPNGRYFAVNLGFEYPDRIEAQQHALLQGNVTIPDACFEYVPWAQALLSWDANVLGRVDASTILPSGTYLEVSANYTQFHGAGGNEGNYANYMDSNHGWGSTGSNIAGGGNFLYVNRSNAGVTMAFSAGGNTCRPSVADSTPINYAAGQPTDGLGWFGMAHFGNDGTNCTYTNDGIDSDVDVWFDMVYLWVKGTSGQGSLIRIETNFNHNGINWANSNCTRNGGGTAGDDDIQNITGGGFCWPCVNSPGPGGVCSCPGAGCASGGFVFTTSCATTYNPAVADPKFFIIASWELPNLLLPGGPRTSRPYGGYQAWNRHICVQ